MITPDQQDGTVARVYWALRRIRRTEEEIARLYPLDKIRSPIHLSIGQEAVAVGVCDALAVNDLASATYRCHATYLAKGGDLNAMMAELFGKATGCAGGKAGSMHLIDVVHGVLGASAVVGSTIPISVGYALMLKREGKGRVVVCFHGDGATEEGVFAESLNFAALHELPILFVCENNGYAIHASVNHRWATAALRDRVSTYGISAYGVADSEVFALRQLVAEILPAVRRGSPAFIECMTYRWREHVGPGEDFAIGYRSMDEARPWLNGDPVRLVGEQLDPANRMTIDADIEREIASAIAFAEASPFPDPSQLERHVFAS